MEYIDEKEIVVIFDRRMGLETIVSKLALLTGEQTKKFFIERSTMIPRKINAMALRGALNERIKTLNSHSLTKDAFVKLGSYATFTEFQLQNLFEKVGTDEDFYTYRKNLWKLLIKNHGGINLLDGELIRLINMKKYASIESFLDYSKAIFTVTLDIPKEFDAYPKTDFENLLKTSFSQDEIRSLGSKYGFNIPLRLKKEDLLQYVKDMMKSRRKLTLVLQRELNNMTITQLNDFCYLQNLGISSSMKKEELINLFLFLIKQANYPEIEANTILGMSFTEPIKFKVDLDAIDNFKRGRPKKVIILEEDETSGIEALDELELVEPLVETPKKKSKQEDLAADIIRKLLPYLNIDEETAKMAIAHGITIPQSKPAAPKKDAPVSPKKKELNVAKKELNVAKAVKEPAPLPQKKKKESGNDRLLEEILAKIKNLKESEKAIEKKWSDSVLESQKQAIVSKKSSIVEDEKQQRVAVLIESLKKAPKETIILKEVEELDDDLAEYDDFDFEPEEDEEEAIPPVQPIERNNYDISSSENLLSETHILEEEGVSKDETSTLDLNLEAPREESSHPELIIFSEQNLKAEETTKKEDVEDDSSNEKSSQTLALSEEIELENESYDPEFEPKNEEVEVPLQEEHETNPSEEQALEEVMEEESNEPPLLLVEPHPEDYKEEETLLEKNPYFKNKKLLSKKKSIFLSILSIVLFIGACISVFAILKALR